MQGQIQKAAQEWATLFTHFPVKRVWRTAPIWLSVILVILVARSASEMTWLIFAPDQVSTNTAARSSSAQITDSSDQSRLNTVADLHLFGVAPKKTEIVSAPIDAPETGLKLTLKGVFAASDPDRAMALIADARNDEKVYKRSESVFSGVTLYEIYPDKVILERSGRFETLNLQRDDLPASSGHISQFRTSRPTPATSTSPDVIRTRTVNAGKRLQDLKKQLAESPSEFMKDVRIEPVYDNDQQMKGIKFTHNDRQVMRALGLRPGDVIVEINGQSVDPAAMTQLLEQMSTLTELSLGIERNGLRENININM